MRVRNRWALAGVLLITTTACGDDGGDPEAFCAGAGPALDLLNQWVQVGDPADPGLTTAAEAMADVADPPSEIADEWDRAVNSITALAEVDRGDPEAVAEANAAVMGARDDVGTVQDYLGRSC